MVKSEFSFNDIVNKNDNNQKNKIKEALKIIDNIEEQLSAIKKLLDS